MMAMLAFFSDWFSPSALMFMIEEQLLRGGAAEKKPRAIQMKSSEYSRQEAW